MSEVNVGDQTMVTETPKIPEPQLSNKERIPEVAQTTQVGGKNKKFKFNKKNITSHNEMVDKFIKGFRKTVKTHKNKKNKKKKLKKKTFKIKKQRKQKKKKN